MTGTGLYRTGNLLLRWPYGDGHGPRGGRVSDHESASVQGLQLWVRDATERAARLLPFAGGPVVSAEAYHDSVNELSALSGLLDHDPALQSAVTVRLGFVRAMRYCYGAGTAEDQERARELLREARDPGTQIGAATTPGDKRWAAWFPLALALPIHEIGNAGGQAPDFSVMLDWATRMGYRSKSARDELRALADEAAKLPLPPDVLAEVRQISRMLSVPLTGMHFPQDTEKFIAMMPPGFPYADQMRWAAAAMSTESSGAGSTTPEAASSPVRHDATAIPHTPPDPANTPGSDAAPSPAADPAPDATFTAGHADIDTDSLALHTVLPTVFGHFEGLESGNPETVNRSLERLRTARDQLPADHKAAGVLEMLIDLTVYMSPIVGGNLHDESLARAHMRTMAEQSADLTHSDAAGLLSITVRVFNGFIQLREAEKAQDTDAFRSLVEQLTALETAVPPGHLCRFMVLLLLGLARMELGTLTGDQDLRLQGLALAEEAATVEGRRNPLPDASLGLGPLTIALDTIRAALAEDPAPIRDHTPPPPDVPSSDHMTSALSLITRYGLTRDPADLDSAITELERVHDGIQQGQLPHYAATALWELAEAYQERLHRTMDVEDLDACLDTAMEALHTMAADVTLQLGAEHGLLIARSGSTRAAQVALWAQRHSRIDSAVAALEFGRALVLRAASASRAVPELLEAHGHHDLAAQWRAAGAPGGIGATATGDLPREWPSRLRRQALEALGYRQRGGLLGAPTLSELAEGVAASGADALVYLVPGSRVIPGMAFVVGPGTGTEEILLPFLSGAESGPLERYLDASAVRSAAVGDPAAERAWEEALATLCEWAYRVLSPVLTDVERRVAATGERGAAPPRIVLVPCGRLGIVPWHAARLPAQAPHDYLCQTTVISYAASGSQFLRTVERAPRDPATAPVLVADPRMDLTHAEREITALRQACYPQARMCGEYFEPSVAPEAAGTPDELLALLAERPSLLHVASHGSAGISPTTSALHLAFRAAPATCPPLRAGRGRSLTWAC